MFFSYSVFMTNSKLLIVFIVCFFIGIFFGDLYLENELIKAVLFVILLMLFFLNLKIERSDLRIYIVIFLGILIGFIRFMYSFDSSENFISNFVGKVVLQGCVSQEVDVRNDKVKYVVESEKILIDDNWVPVTGKVLINYNRYPVFEYGQCFEIKGDLQIPEKIEDFDYDKYLARYGIFAVVYSANIKVLDIQKTGLKVSFYKNIFKFKNIFEKRMSELFLEPHNSFMAGLILGSRKGIPQHLMEDFNITGLTHIIAISGYNITLIIVIVAGLFSFLSRRWMIVFSALFIVCFVILVGASAAVVRAGIMGVISLIALWFGRKYYVSIGLFLAAFFMNFYEPKILIYDVGFQLSFLATAGLLYVSPLIEKYFQFLPEVFEIRESVMMTMSAQILALPVIVLNFGRLSLISPIANLFVLPFLPLCMLFGFFAVASSFVSIWIGYGFAFVGFILLEILIFFVKSFALVKFASLNIEWFYWWMLLIYYYFLMEWIMQQDDL